MYSIESVDKLVETLKKSKSKDYVSLSKSLNIPTADLMKYAFWGDKGYTRNCIERTDDFELLLLCWNPGDATPIHCHGKQRCWVYQVSGQMEEVIYIKDGQNNIIPDMNRILKSGDISYMDDSKGFHTLHNNSDSKIMSLHLYAKPIDSCTYYKEDLDRFVSKDMNYYSYKGKLVNDQKCKNEEETLSHSSKSGVI